MQPNIQGTSDLFTSQSISSHMTELLTQRDLLFFSLLSELEVNKALLGKACFSEKSASSFHSSLSQQFEPSEMDILVKQEEQGSLEQKFKKVSTRCISHNSSLRNDTKNIPKNYGKAILSYIQKSPKSRKLAVQLGVNFSEFMIQVRRMKNKVNSIEGLKKMWGCEDLSHKTKRCIRILSYQFMRKHCLQYIFHSKVRNFGTHIKYRTKLIEGIENPMAFTHIKEY